MKANHIIVLFTFFIGLSLQAQEPQSNTDHIGIFFNKMLDNVPPAVSHTASSCNSVEKINQKIPELKTSIYIAQIERYTGYFNHFEYKVSNLMLTNFNDFFDIYDKGHFDFLGQKAMSAYSESGGFIMFVDKFADKKLDDLGAREEKNLRNFYAKLKKLFLEKQYLGKFIISSPQGDCSLIGQIFRIPKKFKYPYITFEYKIEVEMISCPCNPVGDATKVKSAFFTVSCTSIESVRTGKQGPFRDPIDPKINIVREECCPANEKEETRVGLNDTMDDDKGYFQVGVFGGLPLGEEKDFYSFNFAVNAAYMFNVSQDFAIGIGAGLTHFSGKDNIDGTSFIPVLVSAEHDLSDKFALRANGGYALSTDSDADGGINFGLGFRWFPTSNFSVGPEFQSIKLDGSSFNSFTIGVRRDF